MIDWVRIAIAGAIVAALVAAGVAVRSHWIGVGEDRTQAKWDAQKKVDADVALQLAQERASAQAEMNRNAEKAAYEAASLEKARADRLASAERTAAGLRDAIAKLDADDLSAAAADPRVAAIARRATLARGLLGQCAERRTSLAGAAARLRDQVAGLQAFALNVCHASAGEVQSQ